MSESIKQQISQSAHGDPINDHRPSHITAYISRLTLFLILLVALFLRVYRLEELPAGVDYDESAYMLLSNEIAIGQAHPLFATAYAGREGNFLWLAALSIRLLGYRVFALRLTAVVCGLATIVFTYLLAREMFRDELPIIREWVALFSAAAMAVSYWAVHVNRLGFRANSMPPFIAALMFYLWRGLRRNNWLQLAVAGVLCGLSANTYLAVRAFPLVLLAFAAWVIGTWKPESSGGLKNWRWRRVRQFAFFGLIALVTFSPLGVFFLRHPDMFGIRMSQTSTLDPGIAGNNLWGTLSRVTLAALGIFTVHGDHNPAYNFNSRPIFDPVLGFFFYAGLLVCLYKIYCFFKYRHSSLLTPYSLTPYFLILLWLPIMLMPNILGARGVPHSLRSLGMMPVVFGVPALGIWGLGQAGHNVFAGRVAPRLKMNLAQVYTSWQRSGWPGLVAVAILLIAGGACTFYWYFALWPQDAQAYYLGAADVRQAAWYLSQQNADETDLWVSNDTYRHTTYAALCANYARLQWTLGRTLVLPLERGRPSLYLFDHTNPLDPVLARYIPSNTLQHRELGPDGGVGFEAYLVTPEQMVLPVPQFLGNGQADRPVNLGNAIAFVGYDVNGPVAADGALDVTLYWRVLRDGGGVLAAKEDLTFFTYIVDDLGFQWGGETFFNYPSVQWKKGDIVLFRKILNIAPGAPPGQYRLNIGVFSPSLDVRLPVLNEARQMAGTAFQVGPFDMAAAAQPPASLPPIQQPMQVSFGGAPAALTFLGFDRDRGDLRPGETLALTLYWQALENVQEDYQVSVWLDGPSGQIPLWNGHPVHGLYPFSQWPAQAFIRDRYALRLPTDAAAGDYQLRLALTADDGQRLAVSGSDASQESAVVLSVIHVQLTDRLWAPPVFAHPVGAQLEDKVQLLGYDLDRLSAAPGETIHLTLVWKCLNEMDVAYTVFTHLLDENQQMRGQKDNPPKNGAYPTTLWIAGEIVVDDYDIVIKPDTPPGMHVIEVGMYDPSNLQRLSVVDPTGAVGDRILLGNVQVTGNK